MSEKHLNSGLGIYLNDHLSMVVGECELIQRVARENRGSDLADYLAGHHGAVERQKALLEALLADVGAKPSAVKQSIAWMAEKMGRLKLNDSLLHYTDLARLLEIEVMIGAAHARVLLWETIATVAALELSSARAAELVNEASRQAAELETWHRKAASRLTRLGNG